MRGPHLIKVPIFIFAKWGRTCVRSPVRCFLPRERPGDSSCMVYQSSLVSADSFLSRGRFGSETRSLKSNFKGSCTVFSLPGTR